MRVEVVKSAENFGGAVGIGRKWINRDRGVRDYKGGRRGDSKMSRIW